MRCVNCNKYLPAEGWILVRPGGSTGYHTEEICDLARNSKEVFCSKKCMGEKAAADQDKR